MAMTGIFTAASGMLYQMDNMNVISNNLANVDTTGFKQDNAVAKAFPELLIRRVNDDGVHLFPSGSVDTAPVIGKLGTGVEFNEAYTNFKQGNLIQTHNQYDFALAGQKGHGFFAVLTPQGVRYTRNGNFTLGSDGYLETMDGYKVLDEKGPIHLQANNFRIDEQGHIFINPDLVGKNVGKDQNNWSQQKQVGTLAVVDFPEKRFLEKSGNSLWQATQLSGKASSLTGTGRPMIKQGFLEGSNVNAIKEMVDMIAMNRAYEASQKMVTGLDELTKQLIESAQI